MTKTYKKGCKYVKRAANGLQSIAVPEQGDMSNVLSSTTSMAAAGSQLGPLGALAGGVIGFGTSMYQKEQQDKAYREGKKRNEYLSASRAVSGVDASVDQRMQVFKDGGKVNTKTIEIEGKGTPEIHTDKHFNVKNLGTTPHSKGGNKVEASEGDIVFNTQNSLSKYNKIAAAIQSGDTKTLHKEKNRLPDDNGDKASGGNGGVKPPRKVKPVMFRGKPLPWDAKNRNGQYHEYPDAVAGLADGSSKLIQANQKGSRGLSYPYATLENKAGTQYRYDDIPQLTPINSASNNPAANVIPTPLAKYSGQAAITVPAGVQPPATTTVPPGKAPSNTANNLMQMAGVANNLYQGLKSEKPIDQSYYDPQLNKYTDRSEALRQTSVSTMNVQNSNARNVSGGSSSNLRANQNQSALSNLTRQDSINEQEMARRDSIEMQNTGIKNAAGQYNLQRKDMYQGQIDGTRAAKQAYIDQAASDIGKIGNVREQQGYQRSRDTKLDEMQMAGYKAISDGQHFRNLDGTAGFNLNGKTGTGFMGRGRGRSPQQSLGLNNMFPQSYDKDGTVIDERAKGVKSVKVKSKYKMNK